MAHRKGEEDKIRFRSDRVFTVNDQWFFQTRELDEPFGPYPNREKAERHLRSFLRDINGGQPVAQAINNLRLLADPYMEDDF